jgi:membrane-bound ClpP family serine protease
MNLFYIILLLVLGALFLMAELVLLPGVTIGTILALACYAGAIYLGFAFYGTTVGVVVISIVLLLSLLTVIFSLRAKTWQRFSLKQNIDSVSNELPEMELKVGDRGVAISRIAPMGKVSIEGKYYEAKSVDVLIDQRETVEVVGFENSSVLVRKVQNV